MVKITPDANNFKMYTVGQVRQLYKIKLTSRVIVFILFFIEELFAYLLFYVNIVKYVFINYCRF